MSPVIRVELVGLIPELFRMCPKGANMCSLEPAEEQIRDYPPEARRAQTALAEIYNHLQDEFGWRVAPVVVGTVSPRGFWLSLRYRLGSEPVAVVNGRRVVQASQGYQAVRLAVAEELERA